WMVGQFQMIEVSRLTTVGAVMLATISLGVLVYFVHHISAMLQAPYVITTVSRELEETIRAYCPPREPGNGEPPPPEPEKTPGVVSTSQSNYIQSVDVEGLVPLANEHDLLIRVVQRPGRFVIERQPLAHVWPADRLDEKLERRVA